MSTTIDVVVISYYSGGAGTLYYASKDWTSASTDTPASQFFDGKLKTAPAIKRDVFDTGTTGGASRPGYGDLVLSNDDGSLDALAAYAFDGRSVSVYRGLDTAAFPGGFDVQTFTMQQPVFGLTEIRIKLRDAQASLQVPLQTTKYAGSNSLPAGLEGVAGDLKGKPKPLTYGVATNVPAVCVNTSKLIYQVHDGAFSAIDAVYDRGIDITSTGAAWSSVTSGFTADIIYGVAYNGSSIYVAVGGGNKIRSSPDGVTWTARTSPFAPAASIVRVVWGGSVFVAATAGGETATSPDGITWTLRANASFSPTSKVINGLAYGNGLFLIAGEGGRLDSSSDGITWTARTSSFGTTAPLFAGYGNGIYVLSGGGKYAISYDGITWTQYTHILSSISGGITSMGCSGDTLVAGGDTGQIVTSLDGVIWTRRTSALSTPAINAILVTSGGFIAVNLSAQAEFSADGATWSVLADVPLGGNAYCGVVGGTYIIAGDNAKMASAVSGSYANTTDLEDDSKAPLPGFYKACLSGGYFRLGSSPDGLVTADVTEGATAADRTAAQVFKRVLTKAGATMSAADVTALDSANAAVVGIHIPNEVTVSTILDQIATTVGAWWGVDRTNVIRLQQFKAPSGAAAIALTKNDLQAFERVATNDIASGIPVYSVIVRWGRVYVVQDTDLAAGVTDARRGVVSKEYREAKYTDATVQTAHLLSPQLVIDSLFAAAADALTEATRQQVLRGTLRDCYKVTVPLTSDTVLIDLFGVVTLTHSRYALTSGRDFRVIGIDPRPSDQLLTWTLWG